MIKATGSEIIVKLLEMEGIKTVAGIPGGQVLPLYNCLNKSSLKHVLVRQEQAAGFIAQGMTRVTGKPAVCIATSGPGAMNLLTAIADARCDSIPIIAITGQVNTNLIGTDSFQEADTFGLSFPITKHSMMVKNPKDLLTAIPEAFEIAVSGRPGPVLIDIPRDVQAATVEFESWPTLKKTKIAFARRFCTPKEEFPSRINEMAKTLLSSNNTVLYVGGGCNSGTASTEIKKFLEQYECAVVESLMGIGVVPRSFKNNLGMVGMHGSYAANLAMFEAEVVLACGVRFDDRATGVISKFCPNAKILHIDIDAAEVNKILPSSVSLICDVASTIPILTKEICEIKKNPLEKNVMLNNVLIKKYETSRKMSLENLEKVFAQNDSVLEGRDESLNTTNPREFIKEVPVLAEKVKVSSDDIVVATDVGQNQMWAAQYYPVEHSRQFLTSGSLGTMGFGLPAAIGASLALSKKKRVVCFSGDGSIMMNIQELATLSELGTNVTVIVFQNGTLGMVKQQQQYLFKKNYSASVFEKQPDLLSIAKGFGIDSIDADSDKEWYLKAFKPGPHFVRVTISPDENVLPYVSAGKANVDSIR